MRDDRQDLAAALIEQIVDTLAGQKGIGLDIFAQTRKEQRQVVVVIELFNVDLPIDFVALGLVVDRNGKVAAVVQFSKALVRWVN